MNKRISIPFLLLILIAGAFTFCSAKYPDIDTGEYPNLESPGDTIKVPEPKPEPKTVKWYPVALPRQDVNRSSVLLPASRDYLAPWGVPIRVLFNHWLRDPYILNAPDGYYYMVGTTERSSFPEGVPVSENANGWWYNDGVPLWRSRDLVKWETMGYVWTFERDATWAKEFKFSPHTATDDGSPVRAVWAPEIHYLQGTYWIVYSMNYNGLGILKSTTGKPEGPYVDIKTDGPFPGVIDISLFEDMDGTVYYMTDGYRIARMEDDMSGLAEEPCDLDFRPTPPWAEGITMMKVGDNYVWYGAANSSVMINGKEERTYDCFSATSKSIYGPYENRYRAIPYAGHNNIFRDKEGKLWSTQFHPQPFMPKALEPAILPVTISEDGIIGAERSYPRPVWRYVTAAPAEGWQEAEFDDATWTEGEAGFGNPAIQNVGSVSDVGTVWQDDAIWMRKTFDLARVPVNPHLFLRYTGDVEVWINGVNVYSAGDSPLEYLTVSFDKNVLRTGTNTVAITLKRKDTMQYIDLGVIDKR